MYIAGQHLFLMSTAAITVIANICINIKRSISVNDQMKYINQVAIITAVKVKH